MLKTKLVGAVISGAMVGAGVMFVAFNGASTLTNANANVGKYITSVNGVIKQAQSTISSKNGEITTLGNTKDTLTKQIKKINADNQAQQNINNYQIEQDNKQIDILTNEVNQYWDTVHQDGIEIKKLKSENSSVNAGLKKEVGQVQEANKDVKAFGTKLNGQLSSANSKVSDFNKYLKANN